MDSFFKFFLQQGVAPKLVAEHEKIYPRGRVIPLPRSGHIDASLGQVLRERKTTRTFASRPIDLATLSKLLYWSVGPIHTSIDARRRPYPSGGSLYPIEFYIANLKESDLAKGLYHYASSRHVLELIPYADVSNLPSRQTDEPVGASMIILMSLIKAKNMPKYGNLGYKLGLLEAGHAGQNLILVAAELGLAVLPIGSMNYEGVEEELFVNQEREPFCYHLALG